MKINTTTETPIAINEKEIKESEHFVYLGSVVDKQEGTDRDVNTRIGKARTAFMMLKNIWNSTQIKKTTKLRIFNSNVKTVLLYGCETWRTTKATTHRLQTFMNTCLRRILKINWQDKVTNEDLWHNGAQDPIDKQILKRKWGWIGHTLRKPPTSITRQVLTWNPQGKRKRGRPRNSWRRDTEMELSRQGISWREAERAAQSRVRWRGVVNGLYSPGPKG